jgi:hypothetical protein
MQCLLVNLSFFVFFFFILEKILVEVVIHMGLGFCLNLGLKLWLSVRLDQCARS